MIKTYKEYTPEVSVVLASYNRANYLERSIGSLLKQTFAQWELIFVDDGSSDNTFEFINGILQNDESVRYIKHKNRNLSFSRNTGILSSTGKYITFLDSDDEYKPDHLATRINYMRENPAVDIIHGGIEAIGNPYVKDKNDLSKLIHLSECYIGGTFFGKREVFEALGGFADIAYSEDSDFLERAEKVFNVKKVDFPTYIYYTNTPDSICNSVDNEK